MTVAPKPKPGKQSTARRESGPNPWRRLWQVPLLLGAVALFGVGVRALVRTIRPVPFETQVKGVRSLVAAGEFTKAIEQINILGRYYTQPLQQGELQVLAGDVYYFAQKSQLEDGGGLVRANEEKVEDHYGKAVAWGIHPTVEINERWGEAALALGDARTAVAKLEAALQGLKDKAAGEPDAQAIELIRRHGREMVMAYLELGERDKALAMVDQVLAADKGESKGGEVRPSELEERTWALCQRIEIALDATGLSGAADRDMLNKAIEGAKAALKGWQEQKAGDDQGHLTEAAGRVLIWIGRAELELGDAAAAERELTLARQHFVVHHLDDARATVLLAKIAQARGAEDPKGTANLELAARLFQEVALGQAGTPLWAAARLGRAEVASMRGTSLSADALADFQYAVEAVKEGQDAAGAVGEKPELISREGVRASLKAAFQRASDGGRLPEALALLKAERGLDAQERPDYLFRLAVTQEELANQELAQAGKLEGAGRVEKTQAARMLLARAAANYLRHARVITLDDEASGASLWKAGELFDRTGDAAQAISIYEQLTRQRPRDARVGEGLLALGRLYESQAGSSGGPTGTGSTTKPDYLSKAIEVYQRNLDENPSTPAAYASAVNLARCYSDRAARAGSPEAREESFGNAETALLSLVQGKTNLMPTAQEFREGLRALGELYFQRSHWAGIKPVWADAIYRLEEMETRYPEDPGRARTLFMLAESYRGSAAEIEAGIRDTPLDQHGALESARAERLLRAAEYFSRVIAILDAAGLENARSGGGTSTLSSLDEACLRSSYVDRAQCYYLRGEYEQAIKLYDQAAARFSEDVTAVEAYVQIVNAYLALKQPAQAGAASERGLWLLKRMPDAAFDQSVAGNITGGRAYYEKLLAMAKP